MALNARIDSIRQSSIRRERVNPVIVFPFDEKIELVQTSLLMIFVLYPKAGGAP